MSWDYLSLSKRTSTKLSENFNKSLREGSNKRIDGEAYLRLGQIYYDTLEKV
jgi:hypothetical protein